MSTRRLDLLGLGECMTEFSRLPSGLWRHGFAGDALNTVTAGAQLGLRTGFATTVGTDSFTEEMLAAWRRDGIDCAAVRRDATRANGAYFITTDDAGERSFSYLRTNSAATTTLRTLSAAALRTLVRSTRVFYLTGITLAVMDDHAKLLAALKQRGTTHVAFDPNWRPALWPDRSSFVRTVTRFLGAVDYFFPSVDDCEALFPGYSVQAIIGRLSRRGVTTVAKGGTGGAWYREGENIMHLPAVHTHVVDTTGAGDAFNAGVLAGFKRGLSPSDAVDFAQRVAAVVVGEHGAIVTSRRGRERMRRLSL